MNADWQVYTHSLQSVFSIEFACHYIDFHLSSSTTQFGGVSGRHEPILVVVSTIYYHVIMLQKNTHTPTRIEHCNCSRKYMQQLAAPTYARANCPHILCVNA